MMDNGVVFPGVGNDIGEVSGHKDKDLRISHGKQRLLRPQTAQPKISGAADIESSTSKPQRPLSSFLKNRIEFSSRRVSRQTLRKSHFSAPRKRSPSTPSSDSSVQTAVAHDNQQSKSDAEEETSPPISQKKAINLNILSLVIKKDDKDVPQKPPPESRKLIKHSSFETWMEGSPHDSDEYDTDLDIEDFKKSMEKERPTDPTGRIFYEEQCKKQGVIPASYFQRHLGDRNLRMRHHYLGGFGTKPIAVALKMNTITEVLDLTDNYLESEGVGYIAEVLKDNTFITALNISNNFIGFEGFEAITEMLEVNTTLKMLCVAGNQLTDKCGKCLVECLKSNNSLTALDLSDNAFGEFGGIHIGNALKVNESLVDLDVSWNSIRNMGAAAIINSLLTNTTLEVLDLAWNGLGKVGAGALKVMLKTNTTLKVLDLTNNRFNTEAAQMLAQGLSKNFGLESLILNLNPMKDQGVEAILKVVEKHPSLSFLSLEEISISRANQHKIRELQSKKNIIILYGGIGGYQRSTTAASLIKLLEKFVHQNRSALELAFRYHDRDRTGSLASEDTKLALRQAGLRLTSKQIDAIIAEIDYNGLGNIDYRCETC
ncbi:hypothetical protein CHS0354_029716 [Potamilus streckersoni]|uniref:Uncharacterized protein n=1 Tax=Potamilus streckersoni TaxID=2493646 RepID=A0AAE0RTU6_9BIVA|nr:hypothetical protein CHS0354_029716 [Potamilus streckersoni]